MPKPVAMSVPWSPGEARRSRRWTYLDSVLAQGEVRVALLGLLKSALGVLGRQTSADSAGGLGPQVEGLVSLVLVEQAELVALLDVDDGEDAGNGLAEIVAIGPARLAKGPSPGYRDLDSLLEAACSGRGTYMRLSLEPDEAIFWMRSWPSSVLSSPSCFISSSLFLPQRGPALTLAVDCDDEIAG